jgi:hypothetical protein
VAVTALICLIGLFAAAGGGDSSFGLERKTAADLDALLARARKDGFSRDAITIRAGHRRAGDKHPLAADVIRVFGADELTRWIAARGEHATGKAVDLDLGVAPTVANAQAGAFERLPAHRWLRRHAREFGFNQAFPGEPWHFTHDVPRGAVARPGEGTMRPARSGTVLRRPPSSRRLDDLDFVLTGSAVAWLPAASTIVYTQCWREEGGGDGCVVKWERRSDRKVTRTIPVFLPGDADTEDTRRARLVQARNAIAPLLIGASLLSSRTWADGARPVSVGTRQQLSWDAEKSTLSVSGKSRNVKQLAPWLARPIASFDGPDVDFVVVEMVYDPQHAFTTGANLVSRFEIVEGVDPGLRRKNWRDGLPADVVEFVVSSSECDHWAGEDAYDAERRKQIEDGAQQLGCDRLEAVERGLRSKYAGKPRILAAIDAAFTVEEN